MHPEYPGRLANVQTARQPTTALRRMGVVPRRAAERPYQRGIQSVRRSKTKCAHAAAQRNRTKSPPQWRQSSDRTASLVRPMESPRYRPPSRRAMNPSRSRPILGKQSSPALRGLQNDRASCPPTIYSGWRLFPFAGKSKPYPAP